MVTRASPQLSLIETVSDSLPATQARMPPLTTKLQMIFIIESQNSIQTLSDYLGVVKNFAKC